MIGVTFLQAHLGFMASWSRPSPTSPGTQVTDEPVLLWEADTGA
jgi:hypothetical protein